MWRESTFDPVEDREISFRPAAEADANLRAQLVALRLKETDESGQHPIIVLVNCHLVFNFAKAGLKVAQISRLISEIHETRLRLAPRPTHTLTHCSSLEINVYDPRNARLPAVIMVGDFNFTPYSPIYSYLATGVPPPDFLEAAQAQTPSRLLSGQALMFAHASNMTSLRPAHKEVVRAAMQATPMFCPRGAERGCNARACFKPPNPSGAQDIHKWLAGICPTLNFAPFQETISLCFATDNCQPQEGGEVVEEAHNKAEDKDSNDKPPEYWMERLTSKVKTSNLDLEAIAHAMTSQSYFHLPVSLISCMRLPKSFTPTPDDEYIASEPWATVYQGSQRGTVDYVWVDDSQIRVRCNTAPLREVPELAAPQKPVMTQSPQLVESSLSPAHTTQLENPAGR